MSIQASDLTRILKKFPIPVICAVLGLSGLLMLYFRSEKLGESASNLEQRTKELKRLRGNITASAQIDEQLATLEKADKQFTSSAVRVSELAKNPEIFYAFWRENGLGLPDVKQLSTSAPPNTVDGVYFVIPFTVNVEGEFKTIITFLKHLEFGQQVNRISSASISPTQGQRVSLNFTIEYLGLK